MFIIVNRIKLSDYAKQNGISYITAYRMFKRGSLGGFQTDSGTILIDVDSGDFVGGGVAIYCRVSSTQNKGNLDSQRDRVYSYCLAKGYKVDKVVLEIGSGVNDSRKKWLSLIEDKSIQKIVVEHKDRFSRFGFNAIDRLLSVYGREIEVINNTNDTENDIMQDFISIITSFCARIYGNRRSSRKTDRIIKELESND